jgi:hypothetical protein
MLTARLGAAIVHSGGPFFFTSLENLRPSKSVIKLSRSLFTLILSNRRSGHFLGLFAAACQKTNARNLSVALQIEVAWRAQNNSPRCVVE